MPSTPKLKTLRKLRGLGARQRAEPMPSLGDGPERFGAAGNTDLQRLIVDLGDEVLAKRILKLKAQFYNVISGTIPELLVMDWLIRNGYKYEFQMSLFGGRALRGGQVVDFAVDAGTTVIIIEVQGSYFHNLPGKVQFDEGERMALMGVEVWGKPVKLVEVWDTRLVTPIKERREQVMQMAVQGVELGM